MARIRTIKPEFFVDTDLYDMDQETGLPCRLAFAGLWTHSDREGRFEWKPREIKVAIMPHDDYDVFSRVLDALTTRGFVVKYSVENKDYGWVRTFTKHQVINNRESASCLPPYLDSNMHASPTRDPRDDDATTTRAQGKGKEGKGKEGKGIRVMDAPPTTEEVKSYALQEFNLNGEFAADFIRDNTLKGWLDSKGEPYQNWKLVVNTWVKRMSPSERQRYTPKPKVDNSMVHR